MFFPTQKTENESSVNNRSKLQLVEVGDKGWDLPYRVTFKKYATGAIEIHTVEAFLELFQAYVVVPLNILNDPPTFEQLRDAVSDWCIGEEFDELRRRRVKLMENQEDPNPAA